MARPSTSAALVPFASTGPAKATDNASTTNAVVASIALEHLSSISAQKGKDVSVHKKLLYESARFFDAALHSQFTEGQKGKMYLPEDDPGAFSLYIGWLYRGTIRKGHTEQHLDDLYDLYLLSEKICLVKLQNQTMDAIQDMARKYDLRDELIAKERLEKVLERTTVRSNSQNGLRYFSVYMLSWTFMVEAIKRERDENEEDDSSEDNRLQSKDDETQLIWEISRNDM